MLNPQCLFSYGTLQQQEVQLATFNRILKGCDDILCSYRLEKIKITDEEIIKTSGKGFHPILVYSGDNSDEVRGTVFEITQEELRQADEYEVDEYQRVMVCLKSGVLAWVYVAK